MFCHVSMDKLMMMIIIIIIIIIKFL